MNKKQREFINKVAPAAIKSMVDYGVLASITIAQAILESGWGRSSLSSVYNNYFGIKADRRWTGKKICMNTKEYTESNKAYNIDDFFRWYDSIEESFTDHGEFLKRNRRYRENGVFEAKDYKEQANALLRAGYATSPEYADMLIQLVEQFELYQYDKGYKQFQTFGKINIKELQEFLNSQNITDYENKELIVDGIKGKRTIAAFKKLKEVEI